MDFKLERADGTLADPPTYRTGVYAWRPGDTIPLGIVHYRVRYEVWPGAYMDCFPDEYGLTDPDCYDYEAGNADIDIRVFRLFAGGRRLVHQDVITGLNGRASVDLYGWHLPPRYAPRGSKFSYRIVFRLIDPVTDRVVQIVNRKFRVSFDR